jgi:sec-independent protein translocase protein TatB
MFDFSWGEVLLIGAVALIVIGPKDLPATLRTVGRTIGKVKRMASEFQGQFNEALREADLDKVRKDVEGMNKAASAGFNPVKTIRDEVKNVIDKPDAAKAAAAATVASSASASNAAAFSGTKVGGTKAGEKAKATPAAVEPAMSAEAASTPRNKPEPKAAASPAAKPAGKTVASKPAKPAAKKPAKKSGSETPARKSAVSSRKKEEKNT